MAAELPPVWRERRDNLLLAIAERLLKAADGGYAQAFDAVFGATRFDHAEAGEGDRRRASLVDVVDEIPEVAVQAYAGFAAAADPGQREDAARCLPVLARRFPNEATELLTRLLADSADNVREAARQAQDVVPPRSPDT